MDAHGQPADSVHIYRKVFISIMSTNWVRRPRSLMENVSQRFRLFEGQDSFLSGRWDDNYKNALHSVAAYLAPSSVEAIV